MRSTILVLKEPKKHSVRYDAQPIDDNPIVTSVYIMKSAIPHPYPKMVKLTVEAWPEVEPAS